MKPATAAAVDGSDLNVGGSIIGAADAVPTIGGSPPPNAVTLLAFHTVIQAGYEPNAF